MERSSYNLLVPLSSLSQQMSKTSDSTVICASTIFIYLFTIFITFLAEVDLSDITGVKFKVSIGEDGEDLLSDDAASKIFQRYLPFSRYELKTNPTKL